MSAIASVRWVALETVVSRGIALLSFILIARVLGPELMGLVAILLLVKELAVVISDFGLSQAIIHFPYPNRRQLATLYTINWLCGLLAFCAATLLANWVAQLFAQPQISVFLPIVAFGFLLAPIGQQVSALLQKAMDFRTLAVLSVASAVAGAVVSVGGVYAGFGIWAVVVAGLVSSAVRQILYLRVAHQRQLLHGFALDFRASKDLLKFGLYRTGATGLNFVNSRVDQVIVGSVLGSAALGLYSMATTWSLMTMQQINGIVSRVAFPAISGFQQDKARVRAAYLRLVNRVGTINSAIFFGLAVSAEPLVILVLGQDWEDLIPVLQLMCGYVLLRSLGNLNGPLAMGLGKASWAFYWNLGLIVVVPVVLWTASQRGSLEVVVMALILLQLVLAVLMYVYWTRRLIGPCLADYLKAVMASWISGALMGAVVWGVLRLAISLDPLVQLVVAVPTGAIIYIAGSWLFNRKGLCDLGAIVLGADRMAKPTE